MNISNEMNVSIDELMKIPYINYIPNDGRVFHLQPCYIEDKAIFETVISQLGDGKLRKLYMRPEEGTYWSKNIIDVDNDIFIGLFDLLANCFSFPGIFNAFNQVKNDLLNMGSILYKQVLLFEHFKEKERDSTLIYRVFSTEVEYLMGLIRSYFDLLHNIMKDLFKIYKKGDLPDTMGKFVDNGIEKVAEKYKMSINVVKYLHEVLPLLRICRKVRDDIYHHGKETGIIYIMDNGPGVLLDCPVFGNFNELIWKDYPRDKMTTNNIVSLYYFFNKIIENCLNITQSFETMIRSEFTAPPKISVDYKLFVRSPSIKYINKIPGNIKKCWIIS